MFNKIKNNEAYKKFKEYKKNPQNKAKISLLMWCLLFIVIIFVARINIGGSSVKHEKQYIINSYEYVIYNNKMKIIGSYYNGKNDFVYNNSKYYYNGDFYEIVNSKVNISNLDLSLIKINISFIDDLTKNISYSDNGYKRYLVPLTNFISIYDGDTPVDLSGTDSYNIVIDKYYENNNLKMVKMDLSSYYKYKNISDDGIVTIDFYNLNKVSDFSFEYEKMLGVK